MSKQKLKGMDFPMIPKDVVSQAMLANLMACGAHLMNLGKMDTENPCYQHGVFLTALAGSPQEDPYIYYRIHDALAPLYGKWQPWYNSKIAKQSQEARLAIMDKVLPKEVMDQIMPIQLAIMPIHQRGAVDQAFAPLSTLCWLYVFSWFDKSKWPELYSGMKSVLESMTKETFEDQVNRETEKMVQAGVFPTAGEA
jgi:hypothetical protein